MLIIEFYRTYFSLKVIICINNSISNNSNPNLPVNMVNVILIEIF